MSFESELSNNARVILEKRYLRRDDAGNLIETPTGLFRRVAGAVAEGEKTSSFYWEDRFFDLMTSLRFLPNSPTLVNAGIEGKGCLSACFVLTPEDDMKSIMQVAYDAAMIEKWGGGIGYGLSKLRPRSDKIATTHGRACGPVAVMKLYSAVGEILTQGSFRLGAHMAQLRDSHPDIRDFIHCKDSDDALTNFNISVQITDAFMRAVEEDADWKLVNPRDEGRGPSGEVVGTVRARDLWHELTESAWKTGDPGVVFMDRVWDTAPNPQMGRIETSNPCWSGDTLVWTIGGPRRFDELAQAGLSVEVLTEDEEGDLTYRVMQNPHCTSQNVQTLKVTIESRTRQGRVRSTVTLTPDHQLFLRDRNRVCARDLRPGDRLASVYRRRANSKGYLALNNGLETPLEHVVVAGFKYGERPQYPAQHVHHLDSNKQNNVPDNLEVLPAAVHNALNMMGAQNPMVRFPERNRFNRGFEGPENGMYGVHRYGVENPMYGRKHSEESKAKMRAAKANHVVISIEEGPCIDVYNGTVEETHRYFVQVAENEGILSANCGEEFLENYGNCCLGSINLDKHVKDGHIDWTLLEDTIQTAVRFLDDVIEVNQFPLERLREVNLATRRIGLGVMGWADALVRLGVPYDSPEALNLVDHLGKFLREVAWEESRKLAVDRGAFPEYGRSSLKGQGYPPVRHSSVLTIAPTGTISRLAGCSSGIEPHFATAWWSNVLWDEQESASSRLLDAPASIRESLWNQLLDHAMVDRVLEQIADDPVRGSDILNEYRIESTVFSTTMQIRPMAHVYMQAMWQKHITNSVSKTINLPNSATVQDVRDVLWQAWESSCKAVTVYRDQSKSRQVLETGTT